MTEQLAFWGESQRRRRPGRPSRRARFDRALDTMLFYADVAALAGPTNVRAEPSMLWIQMSDDDWKDPWLANVGMAAFGLYWKALSWANDQTRGRDFLSAESVVGDLGSWFIPDREIRGWKAIREAKQLVEAGIWVAMQGGYRYLYLRDENKPKTVYEKRSRETSRKRKQRAPKPPESAAGRW
ncbi:hypothetical protein [Mycobacterium sp. 23]|uniref:hypothetical protein n=1 Tax=Mycobacterium sp. 23 TaxID=3400424 RepID=UPI003AACB635